MEESKIIKHFEGKTILLTGATGFLAKIFLEKILRIQPNIKKLFILIRKSSKGSIEQRLHQEVLNVGLFQLLRGSLSSESESDVFAKVIPISGDISHDNLGITDLKIRDEMWNEINIIVNSAATTNFDERYDIALGVNAFGAMQLENFARKCSKLETLLHVSTAFVHGTRRGVIPERPFIMGETLNGSKVAYLDIEKEKNIVKERLRELQAHNADEKEITRAMKDLGTQRAQFHGWPNTYVFTKAMGEMLLEKFKGKADVIIIRPTIVTSTYNDPFSGWVEGLRTVDSFLVAYGKGKMETFIGDPEATIDVIPADMVVNCMLVAIAKHSNQPSREFTIYHVGSSVRNPLLQKDILHLMYLYLKKNPLVDTKGKPVQVKKPKVLSTMASFQRYKKIYVSPLLKVLKFSNWMLFNNLKSSYDKAKRSISQVNRLVQLYEPYLFSAAVFDDTKTANLGMTIKGSNGNSKMLGFDPNCIVWEDYFVNNHFPGIVKYVVK